MVASPACLPVTAISTGAPRFLGGCADGSAGGALLGAGAALDGALSAAGAADADGGATGPEAGVAPSGGVAAGGVLPQPMSTTRTDSKPTARADRGAPKPLVASTAFMSLRIVGARYHRSANFESLRDLA